LGRSPSDGAPWAILGLLLLAVAAVGAGCSVRDEGAPSVAIDGLGSSIREVQRLARQEGELDLVVWPDYAQPAWTELFSQETGCAVTARVATTPASMTELLRSGDWDGVSASGDLSGGLMRSGRVAPVDPALVPNYAQIEDDVKMRPFNSLERQPYGVPQGRAANLLVFRTDVLPNTDSWQALWEAPARYRGRLSLYGEPITIADAALYLASARPELEIRNPYELDARQFRAAVRLLRRQAPKVGRYRTRATEQDVSSYVNREAVVGSASPEQARLLEQAGAPVQAVKPKEGTTGWSDTWMVARNADHPNCMYLWMDYVLSPEVQAASAELSVHAPVNLAACALTRNPDHCTELHADDPGWWEDVQLWTTPDVDCGDIRGETCVPYEEWAAAWRRITAPR
jgi:putative spermidine/putrescine transport system substrate-binding protein